MFVVWGTRIRRRRLGRVADFCPVCRSATAFELTRIGAARHVYGLSLGEGQVVGFEACCEGCRTPVELAAPEYAGISAQRSLDLDTLIAETNPGVKELARVRAERDAGAREGRLPAEERRQLLLEPCFRVGPLAERQQREQTMEPLGRRVGYATLALLLGSVVVLGAMQSPGALTRGILAVLLGGFGLGVVATVWFKATHMRSFLRREILPRLVRGLGPLDPSLEELTEIRSTLREAGLVLGRRLDPAALHAALVAGALSPPEPWRPPPIG